MITDYRELTEQAKAPIKGSEHAAGFDLFCTRTEEHLFEGEGGEFKLLICYTDIAFETHPGCFMDLRARSSVSSRGLILCNGAGVGDSDYRGGVQFRFYCLPGSTPYKPGERVGQVVFSNHVQTTLRRREKLSDTVRGEGGFGSSGK